MSLPKPLESFQQGALAPRRLRQGFIQWLESLALLQPRLYLEDLSSAARQLGCCTEDLVELLDYFVFINHYSLKHINLDMHVIDAVFQMRERRAGNFHPDDWNPVPANEHETRPPWRKLYET